ncbi:MAG: PAS domain-containing protein [Bacteroidota bacterium]
MDKSSCQIVSIKQIEQANWAEKENTVKHLICNNVFVTTFESSFLESDFWENPLFRLKKVMDYLYKELQELIDTSEPVFEFIQSTTLDGLWYWDLEQRGNEYFDARFWATIGYSAKNVEDKKVIWEQAIYPEDLDAARKKVVRHIADPTIPFSETIRFRHKNGYTVWLKCRGRVLFNKVNQPSRLLGSCVNITKEKRLEKLLLETNRAVKVGAWEIDLATNQLYWDDITREIHEVPKDFEPNLETGINFYKPGRSQAVITKCVNEAIEKGTPWDEELKLITHTGREIWVRAIGHTEFYEGTCLRVYGVFQDIDQQRSNEIKLRQLNILEAKSKEMEQFAYIASHDLREPLTTMKGYLALLYEEFANKMPTDAKHIIEFSLERAERMDQLIHGLLDYSRLSKVKEIELVDASKTVSDVIADLSVTVIKNEVTFDVQPLPTLAAYPLEFKLLFQNLISNAIKFSKKGIPPVIKIWWKQVQRGWEFFLEDNGIGIEENEQERIFYIFQRLHKQGYEGTGIGLANCKKIVELHNGEIKVTSKMGEGSTFSFTILTAD